MSAAVSLVTGMWPRWGTRWQRIRLRVSRTVDADQAGDAVAIHRSRSSTDGAGPQPAVGGILHQVGQRDGRCPSGAVHGPGGVPAPPGVGVEAEVDAQLPGALPPLAHRSGHHRPPICSDPTGRPGPCVMGK